MNMTHIQELRNIDLWVKMGAIDFDKAKKMAQPHIDAINEKSREIAKKHGIKPRLVGFHNFVH
jgi:polyhydroxyalkanoate synthesis regulator phasin